LNKLDPESLRSGIIEFIKKNDSSFDNESLDKYSLVALIGIKTQIELKIRDKGSEDNKRRKEKK